MRGHNNASYELLTLLLEQVQRNVNNHVFLATHHPAFAQFNENIHRLQAVLLRRHFGMAQEAGVDAGVAQQERVVVEVGHLVVVELFGDTALELLPKLSALDVAVLEQPLAAGELAGHARLRGEGVEIAIDEGLAEHGPETILAADAADLLVCKPMALGGVDRAREIINSARADGADALVTTTIDGAIARAGAVHLAASVPEIRACGLATAGMLGSDLRSGVVPVEDGSIAVPQGKGNIPRR